MTTLAKPITRRRDAALWSREYETRELNRDGDAVDVRHFATEAEAIREAIALVKDGVAAAVVEHHASELRPYGRSEYKEIVGYGDKTALEAFGWTGKVARSPK